MQEVGLAQWMLCFAPVGVLFVLIAFARVRVPRAALVGLVLSVGSALASGTFDYQAALQGATTGLSSAFSILYAIWPAIFLYDILKAGGALQRIRVYISSLSKDSLVLVLLFGWVFSSFLQSITGFGVPVAVCAPFLVALGVNPVPAVVMTLIGHSWGNTYGTLAMAWDALVQMGPVDDVQGTALLACLFLWGLNASAGVIVSFLYGGKRAVVHGLPFVMLMSSIMGGGQVLLGQANQTIAAFIPTLAALVLCVLLFNRGFFSKPWSCDPRVSDECVEAENRSGAELFRLRDVAVCASPFAFLACLSLLVFAVPGVSGFLGSVRLGEVAVLSHAGFVLLVTCAFGFFVMVRFGFVDRSGASAACSSALSRLWGVSAGIIALIVMARVLQSTGQMQVLASGVVQTAGSAYAPFAPIVGTFGAFVTSSNMSSNILLAGFQNEVALQLSVDPSFFLAAQTAGGAAGAAIGPSTILLGAATVGACGKEGEMLKPLFAVSSLQALTMGCVLWAVIACG